MVKVKKKGKSKWKSWEKKVRKLKKKNTKFFYHINFDEDGNQEMPPSIVEFSKNNGKYTIGEKTYALHSDSFIKGTFDGVPVVYYHKDDIKTTVGFYYQKCDKDAKPLYEKVQVLKKGLKGEESKWVVEQRPLVSYLKNSTSLHPSIFNGLVSVLSSFEGLKKLLKDNGKLVMVGMGIIGVTLISVYLAYEMYSGMPDLFAKSTAAIIEGVSKAVKESCATTVTQLTP